MASLTVPAPVVQGLSLIASLKDEAFEEFLSFLRAIPLRIRDSVIFDDGDVQLKQVSPEQLSLAKQAAFSLLVGRSAANLPTETFVKDVIGYIEKEKGTVSDWIHGEGASDSLNYRLITILGLENLNTLAKAYDLLTENVHIFSRARILSDIRPIFGDDVLSRPSAAIITHTLNISFHAGGERQEFSVSLDSKDVQQFIEVLKRAEEKCMILRDSVSSAGMTLVETV